MAEDKVVVYKRGEVENKIDPKVLQLILLDDMQVGLTKLNEHFKKEEYQGRLIDERTLAVTDRVQSMTFIGDWPSAALMNAFLINDGTDRAYIAINDTGNWFTMESGETKTINRSGAEERIAIIFYWCDGGETASVRVTGEY